MRRPGRLRILAELKFLYSVIAAGQKCTNAKSLPEGLTPIALQHSGSPQRSNYRAPLARTWAASKHGRSLGRAPLASCGDSRRYLWLPREVSTAKARIGREPRLVGRLFGGPLSRCGLVAGCRPARAQRQPPRPLRLDFHHSNTWLHCV